eukprot:4687023-Pyramimonas_sp.AAC.1
MTVMTSMSEVAKRMGSSRTKTTKHLGRVTTKYNTTGRAIAPRWSIANTRKEGARTAPCDDRIPTSVDTNSNEWVLSSHHFVKAGGEAPQRGHAQHEYAAVLLA